MINAHDIVAAFEQASSEEEPARQDMFIAGVGVPTDLRWAKVDGYVNMERVAEILSERFG